MPALLFQRMPVKVICDLITNTGIILQSLKGALKIVSNVYIHLD